MDFSMYDARRAGFEKVIFIIKKEIEEDFKQSVGNRMSGIMEVEYAYQDLHNIPDGFAVPEGRGEALGDGSRRSLRHRPDRRTVRGHQRGTTTTGKKRSRRSMTTSPPTRTTRSTATRWWDGYQLGNTVTDNGHVARGLCEMNNAGELTGIQERTRIEKRDGGIAYSEDDGATWVSVPADTTVSDEHVGLYKKHPG